MIKKSRAEFFKLHSHSLKTRLVIFVGALSLVTIVILAMVNYLSLSSAIKTTIDDMIMPITQESASDISSKIDMLKAQSETVLLRTLGSNAIGIDLSTGAYIRQQVRDTGIGATSFVLYKSGAYFTSSDDITGGADADAIKETDIYKEARTVKKTVISDPFPKEDGTGSQFMVVVPGMLNVTSYTLVLYFDADELNSIVNTVQFGETGRVYLINSESRTIADRDAERVNSNYNVTELAASDSSYQVLADVHALALAKETGSTTGKVEGVSCQIAYAPVENSDWAVILVAPEAEFEAPKNQSVRIIIIFSVVILLLTFVFTFLIMSGIVSPIIDTTERLKDLAEGDLKSPVEVVNSKNEVGVLSGSLNETVTSLNQYIDEISGALANISEGNLVFEMNGEFKGDFIEIKNSFEDILSELRKTFEQINLAAVQVNDGASQVSEGAQLLSGGAIQQSEAINNVSNQMEDIVRHVTSNTDAAAATEELVNNIKQQIDACSGEMANMLQSMQDITKSSSQISEIIKVIDDIAFQTNILALNAAVEAARAGEAGRGFAVVADEVRSLANMSADAAAQTNELIDDSIRNIKHGMVIAKTTASALEEIVTGAAEINEKISLIVDASREQANVVTAIKAGVVQVTEVIDNNTSTAEESAAAAEQMSSQADMLSRMIAKFKYSADETDTAESDEETEPIENESADESIEGTGDFTPIQFDSDDDFAPDPDSKY